MPLHNWASVSKPTIVTLTIFVEIIFIYFGGVSRVFEVIYSTFGKIVVKLTLYKKEIKGIQIQNSKLRIQNWEFKIENLSDFVQLFSEEIRVPMVKAIGCGLNNCGLKSQPSHILVFFIFFQKVKRIKNSIKMCWGSNPKMQRSQNQKVIIENYQL